MFGRKKISAIDRRLKELQREMSEVGGEIKNLSRYEKGKDIAAEPPGFAVHYEDSESKSVEGAVSSAAPAPETTDNLPSSELNGGRANVPLADDSPLAKESDMPLFERRPPISATGREKFANYFTAGHFQNLRPLRVERRIVRNKALFMIVLVVLALIWLIFSLNSQ